jgi:hypothetical protein
MKAILAIATPPDRRAFTSQFVQGEASRPMLMQAVTSSVIDAIGYDEDGAWLLVRFNNGRLYRYRGVPEAEFDALVQASSIGGYYNRHIRDAFPYEELG